jgi:hypothetical protein
MVYYQETIDLAHCSIDEVTPMAETLTHDWEAQKHTAAVTSGASAATENQAGTRHPAFSPQNVAMEAELEAQFPELYLANSTADTPVGGGDWRAEDKAMTKLEKGWAIGDAAVRVLMPYDRFNDWGFSHDQIGAAQRYIGDKEGDPAYSDRASRNADLATLNQIGPWVVSALDEQVKVLNLAFPS